MKKEISFFIDVDIKFVVKNVQKLLNKKIVQYVELKSKIVFKNMMLDIISKNYINIS